jgi:hypothetical protein
MNMLPVPLALTLCFGLAVGCWLALSPAPALPHELERKARMCRGYADLHLLLTSTEQAEAFKATGDCMARL